jgi:hypothetical protein
MGSNYSTRSQWWLDASKPPAPVDSKFINLYFGIHTCSVNKGMRQRATIDTIDAVNCLFAEFDLAKGQQPEHLLEAIRPVPTRLAIPSIISVCTTLGGVMSGTTPRSARSHPENSTGDPSILMVL